MSDVTLSWINDDGDEVDIQVDLPMVVLIDLIPFLESMDGIEESEYDGLREFTRAYRHE